MLQIVDIFILPITPCHRLLWFTTLQFSTCFLPVLSFNLCNDKIIILQDFPPCLVRYSGSTLFMCFLFPFLFCVLAGDQVVAINNAASQLSSTNKQKEQQQQQTGCLIEPTDQVRWETRGYTSLNGTDESFSAFYRPFSTRWLKSFICHYYLLLTTVTSRRRLLLLFINSYLGIELNCNLKGNNTIIIEL